MRPFKSKKSQQDLCMELLAKNRWWFVSSDKIQRYCWTLHHTNLIRVLRKKGLEIIHIQRRNKKTRKVNWFYMLEK